MGFLRFCEKPGFAPKRVGCVVPCWVVIFMVPERDIC